MKVLVIQQKMIGDVLTSSILCQNLKENLPGVEVHYLVNSSTEAVVIGNPFIDRIIRFTEELRKSKLSFYKFLREISREEYDIVLDVYCKLESNLISLFSGAKTKISYKKWYSSFIYTHVFSYARSPASPLGLAIENRLLLLRPILPEVTDLASRPKIYLMPGEIEAAEKLLKENGVVMDSPLIMLAIFGSSPNKTYPLPYMAQLIDAMARNTTCTFLFNFFPSQRKRAEELYSLCSPSVRERIILDAYAPSLRSFLAILPHCSAVIGNEGGAMNMAKALNIPTFSIFSPWISKKAWDTFADAKQNEAVHLEDFRSDLFLSKSGKTLKEKSLSLYSYLKPELFREKLLRFLKETVLSDQ